jgi:hypothetical protein
MKTHERLLGRIDAEAGVRRLSRSAFLALAAEREMAGGLPAARARAIARPRVRVRARPGNSRAG